MALQPTASLGLRIELKYILQDVTDETFRMYRYVAEHSYIMVKPDESNEIINDVYKDIMDCAFEYTNLDEWHSFIIQEIEKKENQKYNFMEQNIVHKIHTMTSLGDIYEYRDNKLVCFDHDNIHELVNRIKLNPDVISHSSIIFIVKT